MERRQGGPGRSSGDSGGRVRYCRIPCAFCCPRPRGMLPTHLVCRGEVGNDDAWPQGVFAAHPGLGILECDRQIQVIEVAAISRSVAVCYKVSSP